MVRALFLPLTVVAAVGVSACRPLLDGGWQGDAGCPGDTFPVSAIFNEDADGDINGVVYIEGINILLGEVIARADVKSGAVDDDGTFSFDLNTDNDALPEFKVDMEYDKNDFNELNGDIDQIDDNGEVTQTCDLDLERTTDPSD